MASMRSQSGSNDRYVRSVTPDSIYSRSHSLQRGRRSPSPSEYFHQRNLRLFHMKKRVHELNEFIEQSVNKFLDKNSVCNLINDYNEDTDTFGEQIWHSNDLDYDIHHQYTNFLHLDRTEKIKQTQNSVITQLKENKSIRRKSLLEAIFQLIKLFSVNKKKRRNALQVEQALAGFDEEHHLKSVNPKISCF